MQSTALDPASTAIGSFVPMPAAPIDLQTREPGSTEFAGLHPIRVLHVINGEHYSGAERVQDLLAMSLPQQHCEVGFATLKSGKFAETRESQLTPVTALAMRSRLDLRGANQLAELVKTEHYDLLHAHTPRALMLATIAAWRTSTPLVYHIHSPVGRDSTRWLQNAINAGVERVCLRRVDRVIVVAPSLVAYMRGMGVKADRIDCVPNGVPGCDREPCRRRRQHDAFQLGMVALFRPRKGTEVLLDAFAAAVSQGHRLKLRLIGGFESDEYQCQLRRRAERLGIDSAVEWVGFTRDIAGQLAQLDALVLPSLFGEGLPMVVLEAMAAGVPVVASHVEGNSHAVVHRETGLLFDPGNVGELAAALVELADARVDSQRLARQARNRHAELFSDSAMAAGVAQTYRKVLAARFAR